MDYPTPKIAQHCFRLAVLAADLNKQIGKLQQRLHLNQEIIVLNAAIENIVDKKKEKENRKKEWKVTLKEIIDTGLEYEELH
jgi:hypothetical protein